MNTRKNLSLLLLLLLLTACEDAYRGMIVLDGVHEIAPGDDFPGSILLLDGAVVVGEGATVGGDVYQLNGRLETAGAIRGDVTLVGGELALAETALVAGRLSQGGGQLARAPGATVGGGVEAGGGLEIPVEWTARQRTAGDVLPRSLVSGLLLGLLAALMAQFMPRPLARAADAAAEHPLVAASLGALALVVGLVLLVIMAFTVILLPVTGLGLLVGAVIVYYGQIALGSALGRRLARLAGRPLSHPAAAFAGTLLYLVASGLLELLPVVGPLLSLLLVVVGAGAVLLTRFGTRRFVPVAAGVAYDPAAG